jgi:transposase
MSERSRSASSQTFCMPQTRSVPTWIFGACAWVVEFLSHLLRHIPGTLLVIWDGLKSHRSRLVWDFVHGQRGRIWLEFLPTYAPELNPVEYLWSH